MKPVVPIVALTLCSLSLGEDPIAIRYVPCEPSNTYFRVWSDGRVDRFQDCHEMTESSGVPNHPSPVTTVEWVGTKLILTYEDGRVDFVEQNLERCVATGEEATLYCNGDVNRDFRVDFDDLLTVMSQWGPCEE